MNLLDRISAVKGVGNGKNPLVSWLGEFLVDIINIFVLLDR